ncbi:DUF3592 domain-containing protein [Natronomonas marina]|jgi:hypothetical protein|uniref:DUF3592 domain-containing protein n=1 Tax=Natronomonas marina TaxID=2961939 RepID=UPI0020C95994|nr:DUF3592 domain-containing protein [Natronomonas marina]
MDTKGVGAVGALLLVGGILGVIGVVPTVSHHIAVQENQPTEATIQSTDIAVKTDDDGDRSYRPVVTYEYTVDGETYTSDNVYPGGFTRWDDSRGPAENVVSQYDPGDQVTVQYRPGEPGNAYLRNDGMPGAWLAGVGCALVVALGGLGLVKTGFTRRKQRTLMRDTPTEDVEALSVGPSEVKGSALAADGPIQAPFSDEECVVADYEIEEYDDNDDDPGNWHTVESGVLHTPFLVDDGTGRVRVEPHDEATYELDPDDWTTTYVDSGDRGPAPVQQFVDATEGLSYPADATGKDNDRRYKQNLVRDKESVYVFGTAQPRDGDVGGSNADRLVVRKVGEDDALEETMFLISDDEEADLVDRREWAGWRLPVGGLFTVAGFAIALFLLGPLAGLELPVVF